MPECNCPQVPDWPCEPPEYAHTRDCPLYEAVRQRPEEK